MKNRHGSPFEHASFTFLIHAPIFVAREFMRHRMASYNEESGRYKQLEPVFYVPDVHRKLRQVGKPGHYEFEYGLPHQWDAVRGSFRVVCEEAYRAYEGMLAHGVAREVARMILPVNIYTSFYVTLNARALMNFLSLRTIRENSSFPSFPQCEIEMAADQMESVFGYFMPVTWKAFDNNGRVAP
jgi:thymidylate synthase (FAD)